MAPGAVESSRIFSGPRQSSNREITSKNILFCMQKLTFSLPKTRCGQFAVPAAVGCSGVHLAPPSGRIDKEVAIILEMQSAIRFESSLNGLREKSRNVFKPGPRQNKMTLLPSLLPELDQNKPGKLLTPAKIIFRTLQTGRTFGKSNKLPWQLQNKSKISLLEKCKKYPNIRLFHYFMTFRHEIQLF